MPAACPLCRADRGTVREEIAAAAICRLYREQLSVDVSGLFAGIATVSYAECVSCGLGYYNPPVTGDGAFYARLQGEPWYYARDKYEHAFVVKLIGPAVSVLDIGSGDGAFARYLPPGASYTGLDTSGAAVAEARRRGLAACIEPVESHAVANAGRYDVVVCFQSLEHVADPHSLLTAAAQCVSPGGSLVVAVPSEDSFLRFASNVALNTPPHHVTRWPDSALRSVARLIGFELRLVHHEPLQDVHGEWGFAVMAGAMLGYGRRLVEERRRTLLGRLRSRAASVLGRALHRALPRKFWPRGHSVIAVYSR